MIRLKLSVDVLGIVTRIFVILDSFAIRDVGAFKLNYYPVATHCLVGAWNIDLVVQEHIRYVSSNHSSIDLNRLNHLSLIINEEATIIFAIIDVVRCHFL